MAATAQTTDPKVGAGGLQQAVRAFLAREARIEMPEGEWRGRIWFPSPEERRECCAALVPTAANPQALENHCRTLRHLALLFDVPLEELKRAVRKRRSGALAGGAQERAQLSAAPGSAPEGHRSSALDELVRTTGRARWEARRSVLSMFEEIAPLVSLLRAGETAGDEPEDAALSETLHALLDRTKALQAAVDFWLTTENVYRSARSVEQSLIGVVKKKASAA